MQILQKKKCVYIVYKNCIKAGKLLQTLERRCFDLCDSLVFEQNVISCYGVS